MSRRLPDVISGGGHSEPVGLQPHVTAVHNHAAVSRNAQHITNVHKRFTVPAMIGLRGLDLNREPIVGVSEVQEINLPLAVITVEIQLRILPPVQIPLYGLRNKQILQHRAQHRV